MWNMTTGASLPLCTVPIISHRVQSSPAMARISCFLSCCSQVCAQGRNMVTHWNPAAEQTTEEGIQGWKRCREQSSFVAGAQSVKAWNVWKNINIRKDENKDGGTSTGPRIKRWIHLSKRYTRTLSQDKHVLVLASSPLNFMVQHEDLSFVFYKENCWDPFSASIFLYISVFPLFSVS